MKEFWLLSPYYPRTDFNNSIQLVKKLWYILKTNLKYPLVWFSCLLSFHSVKQNLQTWKAEHGVNFRFNRVHHHPGLICSVERGGYRSFIHIYTLAMITDKKSVNFAVLVYFWSKTNWVVHTQLKTKWWISIIHNICLTDDTS